jgi:DNA-binding NarL/FixJ family response regulator
LPIPVFLVEDMKPIRTALTEQLAEAGDFEVVGMAATEAEANLWLEQNTGAWKLAIIDLILEQGTGMRVIKQARKAAPDGHIVVFSDFATPGIEAHCRRLGANAVFDKSSGPADLVAYCVKCLVSGGT